MSDLDEASAIALGGWDERYAIVLAVATRNGVAAAIVDTNGDGADVDPDRPISTGLRRSDPRMTSA